jgi:hypothetical protein
MTGTSRPVEIDGIMNVQELIDLLEDCDPEAFGSRTCRAGRWPSSCAAWPCPMTGRMRSTRRSPEAGAPLRVVDCSVAFTERSQHLCRQRSSRRSRSARCLRSTAWASDAERRAACLADSSPSPSSTLALHPPLSRSSDPSGRDRPLRPVSRTSLPISRSDVRHTSCILAWCVSMMRNYGRLEGAN